MKLNKQINLDVLEVWFKKVGGRDRAIPILMYATDRSWHFFDKLLHHTYPSAIKPRIKEKMCEATGISEKRLFL